MQTDMFQSEDIQEVKEEIRTLRLLLEKVRKALFCLRTKDKKEFIDFMDETRAHNKELERNMYNVMADNYKMKVTLYGEEPKIYSIKEG